MHNLRKNLFRGEQSMESELKQETGELDVKVYRDFDKLPHDSEGIITDSGMLLFVVLQGELQLSYSETKCTLQRNDGAMMFPSRHFRAEWIGQQHDVMCISIDYSVLKHFFFDDHEIWQRIYNLQDNPVLTFTDEDSLVFALMGRIIELKDRMETTRSHYGQMCLSLIHALFYMVIDMLAPKNTTKVSTTTSDTEEIIFRRFLHLLHVEGSRLHKVSYYAERLCISPQYLSKVCNGISGKSPSDYIKARLVDEIRKQLLYTDKSNKEISADLNFSSSSFFGRFVRENLGATPKELRLRTMK